MKAALTSIVVALLAFACSTPVWAIDPEHRATAERTINRGVEYLRSTQNPDGSWMPKPGPAVTAMAITAMLDHPDIDADDPAVARGLAYVLSKVQPDGGIHDGILENYNTAICLSALARVKDRPGIADTIRKAQDYLRGLQWSNQPDATGTPITEAHPFFGGAGYGNHGRPDMSNTQIMLEGLYDSGLPCDDPAFQRALVFIQRCQGIKSNTEFGDKIVNDGGFIYATSIDKDHVGVPQSMASPELIDEAKLGRPVSGLRTYGSMTYAGFKSYLYAELPRDDERVVAAFNWIRRNYTLDRNPGLPASIDRQGLFYYYVTFSRALRAWGSETIDVADGVTRVWAHDLIDKLASLQREDGSWANDADRWMEGDPSLVTAYALIALNHAVR